MSLALAPTKTEATENFPVASLLLARAVRAPVVAFYRFVRTADDVADSPDLTAREKLRRLGALEEALLRADPTEPAAAALAAVQETHGSGIAEAQALLQAFRQDAQKSRYADWEELLAYCRLSAVPVGRFLLRLHNEPRDAEPAADALCVALQILNHLQDLGRDRAQLDRIYLPEPWLAIAGGEAAFFATEAAERRRPILDSVLDQTDELLAQAAELPAALRSARLAAQARATLACAHALAGQLRRADPIRERVALTPGDVARAGAMGLARTLLRRGGGGDPGVTAAITRRSRSSFARGMASLAGERRRGIHAIYAFCRVVDDIADGAMPEAEKTRFLAGWREEVDRLDTAPRTPVGRELAWACRRFDLPRAELGLLLDGMSLDASTRVRLADDAALDRYCRQVAGTVGLLAVRIFGAVDADIFALRLARALQLVNILRDAGEDARRDRVYIPMARLAAMDAAGTPALELLRAPAFGPAWTGLLDEAEAAFRAADAALDGLDRRPLLPALLMLWSYRPLVAKLRRRGWRPDAARVRLDRKERLSLLWLALRGQR